MMAALDRAGRPTVEQLYALRSTMVDIDSKRLESKGGHLVVRFLQYVALQPFGTGGAQ
jgi:hypothetical protein